MFVLEPENQIDGEGRSAVANDLQNVLPSSEKWNLRARVNKKLSELCCHSACFRYEIFWFCVKDMQGSGSHKRWFSDSRLRVWHDKYINTPHCTVMYLERSEEQHHSYIAFRDRMSLFCAESRLNFLPHVSNKNECDSLINHSRFSKFTFTKKIDKLIIITHDCLLLLHQTYWITGD